MLSTLIGIFLQANKRTPFEVEAGRHKQFYKGGKIDDITVVVALVEKADI